LIVIRGVERFTRTVFSARRYAKGLRSIALTDGTESRTGMCGPSTGFTQRLLSPLVGVGSGASEIRALAAAPPDRSTPEDQSI